MNADGLQILGSEDGSEFPAGFGGCFLSALEICSAGLALEQCSLSF